MKAQYFQTVERIFLESTGRGLVISESDRCCIERWFSAGVPLDVVGRGVSAACIGRETPVRSLSLADREVEKSFKAWKSRQLGADRTVAASYADAFDVWIDQLGALKRSSRFAELAPALEQTLEIQRTLRAETEDATLLQSGLLRAEVFLYEVLWDTMDASARLEIVSLVGESFQGRQLGSSGSQDEQRQRMRNKKLRQRFALPVFEIQLDGGW